MTTDTISFVWSVMPTLLSGLRLTLIVTVIAFGIALVLGVPICLLRVSRHRTLRAIGMSYVTAVRNTPLLAQLYVYFYLLPEYGILLSPMTVGVLGLATQFSAYIAEAYRAGYEAVPSGQWEAAQAVGLGRVDVLRRVVAPQAVRPAIPVLANISIQMIKDSSVLSAVTLTELFGATKALANQTFEYTVLYTLLALLYLAICYPAGRLVGRLERKMGKL